MIILFDIDGTIFDMRYTVLHVLQVYDKMHKTNFFTMLTISDITVHENQVDRLLRELQISVEKQKEILDWYNKNRWTSACILVSHFLFSGVLEVIRWFQIQPNTLVGLNTGQPEPLRGDTLRSLNKVGQRFKIQFTEELLHMNPSDWETEVRNAKVEGVRLDRTHT